METNTKVDWLRAYYILGDDKKSNSLFAKIVKWEEEQDNIVLHGSCLFFSEKFLELNVYPFQPETFFIMKKIF
mgnify:CR=1 FL=1